MSDILSHSPLVRDGHLLLMLGLPFTSKKTQNEAAGAENSIEYDTDTASDNYDVSLLEDSLCDQVPLSYTHPGYLRPGDEVLASNVLESIKLVLVYLWSATVTHVSQGLRRVSSVRFLQVQRHQYVLGAEITASCISSQWEYLGKGIYGGRHIYSAWPELMLMRRTRIENSQAKMGKTTPSNATRSTSMVLTSAAEGATADLGERLQQERALGVSQRDSGALQRYEQYHQEYAMRSQSAFKNRLRHPTVVEMPGSDILTVSKAYSPRCAH